MGTRLDLLKGNRRTILGIGKRSKCLSISIFRSVSRGEDTDTDDLAELVGMDQVESNKVSQ